MQRKLSHSQNFFRDKGVVQSLVDGTTIGKRDTVVEIGPGRGVITEVLSTYAGLVIAIEIDRDLYNKLRLHFQSNSNVSVVQSDFLSWSLPTHSYKIFSNIPFNTSADIVKKITANPKLAPKDAYLVMQKEAAEKYVGTIQRNKRYSLQSVLLYPDYLISIESQISRYSFKPVPRVAIVLLRIHKREQPLVVQEKRLLFRDFVVYGFGQWKPTLGDSYAGIFSREQVKNISRELNILTQKPSQVEPCRWVELFEVFSTHVSLEKQKKIHGSEQRLLTQQAQLSKQYRTRKL